MLRRRTNAASWWRASLPAQTRDERACPGEFAFIIRCSWRIAAIAHGFKGSITLTERDLSYSGISRPLGEAHQCKAFIPKTCGPIKRHALERPFLQRLTKGGDRLLQLRRPTVALAERSQRSAEIVLRRGPLQRHALARPFL